MSTDAAWNDQISSPMVAALEHAWADIRSRDNDVPPAVVILGAGSIGAPAGMLKLGHFAATRWNRDGDQGERLAEVFIGGEGLARGPVDVLGTLLHESAHAIAHVRVIQDTSRQGRWHNARFKALAEEVGIEVTKDPRLGWSPTTLRSTGHRAASEDSDRPIDLDIAHARRVVLPCDAARRAHRSDGTAATCLQTMCECGG